MSLYTSIIKRNFGCTASIKKLIEDSYVIVDSKLDRLDIEDDVASQLNITTFKRDITFKNLFKKYNDTVIFENLNLKIHKNEKIAITGHNGSGKTKFCKMLVGIERYEGEIFIDDVNIDLILPSSRKKLIGFVPQEDVLFSATIMDNLRLFDKSLPEEKIYNCAESFGLHSELKRIGYNMMASDDGTNIGAGTRQKICMLRAIIQDTEILVLDEITSKLDKKSELIIVKKLLDNLKDKTIVMIVHNLELLKEFDKIIFFNNQQATEATPLNDLINNSEDFATYYNNALNLK